MTTFELFMTVFLGNFAFYFSVRTYFFLKRKVTEFTFKKLIESGKIRIVSLDQLDAGQIENKDDKKTWN